MKICYIAGAAARPVINIKAEDDDLVIAADAGYNLLKSVNVTPDYVIGDFDSLGYVPDVLGIKVFPSEKDDTDMELAVKHGLALGYKNFVIFGGLGGKGDLEFANYQLVRKLSDMGARGILVGDGKIVTAISNESLHFPAKMRGRISVFAPSGAKGVCEKGLKYTLTDYSMSRFSAIGVSNEFTGQAAEIACSDGDLLLMWEMPEYKFALK